MPVGRSIYRGWDQAGLDAQLNLRARHADHPEFFQRWAAESAAARERLIGQLDLAYGEAPGERLDFFPAAEMNAPILIFIHGGYWQGLDKGDFSFLAPAFVAAGISFLSINYTLAPEAPLAQMIEECRRAARWVEANATDLGGDRDRIHVAGHSAGGHLAAALLATDWAHYDPLSPRLVKGAVAISGIYDLEPIRLSYQNPILKLDEASAKAASPIHNLPEKAEPLVLAVGSGESEEFLRQQEEFAAAWRNRGGPISVVEMPGYHHFDVVGALGDPASPLHAATLALIGRSAR